MNDWMKDQGVVEGDEVVFSENSEYEMTIEGEKLLRMRNEDILATVNDEGK
jgi:co-chaperonin GroES (HSP10)